MKAVKPYIRQLMIDVAEDVYNITNESTYIMIESNIHKKYDSITLFIYNIIK